MGDYAWVLSKIGVKGDGECITSSIQAALRHKGLDGAADKLKREKVLQKLRAKAESDATM